MSPLKTYPQLVCSSVLAHGSLDKTSSFNTSSSPPIISQTKVIFSSVVSWPFYLYRTHLYSLYCYSRTFLTSYKILIQAKGLLVAPASLPTPQHPAQASSRCSLRTEDVRGSAHLLSVQIVRLNSLHCTISYVHAVGPAVPSAWNVFQSLFF